MQDGGPYDPFGVRETLSQFKEASSCLPGMYFSTADNKCMPFMKTPAAPTTGFKMGVEGSEEFDNGLPRSNPSKDPNSLDTGDYQKPTADKLSTFGFDPSIALRGATAGLSWLAGMKERNRQNSYMYNQYSTLGQNAPVNIEDYQPNRFSMYAKYGGKLKKQQGGRLVSQVPEGYSPVPNKPNYYSRSTQGSVRGTVQGQPQASNADWNAFLMSPQGQQWQRQQNQTDTVYTQQRTPINNLRPVSAFRGQEVWENNRIVGAYGDQIRNTTDDTQAGQNQLGDLTYWQDRNDLNQPMGQPFAINRNEVIDAQAIMRPVVGRQKLDSSRNAAKQRVTAANGRFRMGGKMKSKYRSC